MKLLLFGKNGQLGWELQRTLAPLGQVICLDFPQVDLANPDSMRPMIADIQPDVIVNAAAYTAVDRAESEPQLAYAINAHSPGVMAEEAARSGSALIHISTDYVFDGSKGVPYTEDDQPRPLGVYAASKLAGEQAIAAHKCAAITLRTAWVYSTRRDSFVSKVLQWARQQETLRVVDDQVSNPTWSRALAETIALLLARAGNNPAGYLSDKRGVYHLAGSGYASRLAWAKEILHLDPQRSEQVVKQIVPAKTSDFPTPAERPLFSAMHCERFEATFGLRLPEWQDCLRLALDSGTST